MIFQIIQNTEYYLRAEMNASSYALSCVSCAEMIEDDRRWPLY